MNNKSLINLVIFGMALVCFSAYAVEPKTCGDLWVKSSPMYPTPTCGCKPTFVTDLDNRSKCKIETGCYADKDTCYPQTFTISRDQNEFNKLKNCGGTLTTDNLPETQCR